MSVTTWAIVLIVIGSLLVLLLLIWLLVTVSAAKWRRKRRAEFEQRIYEKKRQRAEATLDALRAANIAKSQPSPIYQVCTTHGSYTQPGACPICYPTQQVGQQRQPMVVEMPVIYQPEAFPTTYHIAAAPAQTYALPAYIEQPVSCGGGLLQARAMYQEPPPGIRSPSPISVNGGGGRPPSPEEERIRLAQNETEIPPSPPPIAPPGYVTVPMVREVRDQR